MKEINFLSQLKISENEVVLGNYNRETYYSILFSNNRSIKYQFNII